MYADRCTHVGGLQLSQGCSSGWISVSKLKSLRPDIANHLPRLAKAGRTLGTTRSGAIRASQYLATMALYLASCLPPPHTFRRPVSKKAPSSADANWNRMRLSFSISMRPSLVMGHFCVGPGVCASARPFRERDFRKLKLLGSQCLARRSVSRGPHVQTVRASTPH